MLSKKIFQLDACSPELYRSMYRPCKSLQSSFLVLYFCRGMYLVHPLNNVALLDLHYHYYTYVNTRCLNNIVVFFT